MKERHIKVEDLMKSFNPHSSDDPQQSHAIRHGHLGIQHHIKVEDLLKSFKTHSSEDPQQSHASRQGRLRAHHRHLLDSVVNADLQTVNAPGFPKSAHSKNPTSTFIKPDMMISAFTAGLTTEQAIMEMSLPGFPSGFFGNSVRVPEPSTDNSVLETLLGPNERFVSSSSSNEKFDDLPPSPDVPSSVAALLEGNNLKTGTISFSVPSNMIQDRSNGQNKMRKPFFMPYINKENVERGIKNGDLIKGILRVNPRNFEEAYIDNPEGDDLQDIMILGIHDRNRALHGDIVVVKFKDRNHWIVRDSLYESWRAGHMKLPCDDDGTPLPIPPVKPEGSDNEEKNQFAQAMEFLPLAHQSKIDKEALKKPIPIVKNKRYNQEMMLNIAAQCELNRLQEQSPLKNGEVGAGDKEPSTSTFEEIDPKAAVQIVRLNITRGTKASPSPEGNNSASPNNHNLFAAVRRTGGFHNANSLQRRLNYRVLGDLSDEDWGMPDVCLQKTAEIVYISELKHCRTAVGQLKAMADGNRNWGLFSPNDSRIPRMFIPANELPEGFFDRPRDFTKFIFIARLVEWQATAQFARGRLYKSLGTAGDIEAETEGLLISNDIDTREFSQSALESLPFVEGVPWTIDEKEFKYRRDFRDECLFTIDPATARDLDDALHIKPIDDCDGEGNKGWEVGVHIADVSHFLQPNTELDKWAEHRATSVYLVHKVIPMLPRILCEELCSLNSGVDRLTFSVVWKMDDAGKIKDEWFGRSVIHSCVKLAYEHAQDMIDHPDKEFNENELPPISNKKTAADIKKCVLNLNHVAVQLKQKRLELGALRLDADKLRFVLDKESGLPRAVGNDERKAANFLVEEYMLLANQCVAKKIESHYPETSLLRRHPPPKQKVLQEMAERCEAMGYPIDIESSHSIAQSLVEYYENDDYKVQVFPVLVQYMMKCMQLAVYFCSATQKSYHHYALNVPYYTHFTSPIRRYPDVIVHRLLAAALDYVPEPTHTVKELDLICHHCNDRKVNAKAVSDQSAEMFFSLFIREVKQLECLGVVVGVLDAAVDVYLLKYNIVKRIYTNRLKLSRDARFIEGTPGAIILYWDPAHVAEVRNQDIAFAANQADPEAEKKEKAKEKENKEGQEEKEHPNNASNADFEQTLTVCSFVRLLLTPTPEPVKFMGTIIPNPGNLGLKPKDIAHLL